MHQEVPNREVNGYLSFALAYPTPWPSLTLFASLLRRFERRTFGPWTRVGKRHGGRRAFSLHRRDFRLATDASEFQCADAESIGPLYIRVDFRLRNLSIDR